MQATNKRNSNFDLMKIVSIIMIIFWTIIRNGNIFSNCNNRFLELILFLIECYLVVHFNSLILLEGYNEIDKQYNRSKFFKIINASWFYRVVIVLIFLIFEISPINNFTVIRECFIFDILDNWFVKIYLILYLISPFINKMIKSLNRKDFKKLLILLFLTFSILPFITIMGTVKNDGYTLYSFIFLYLLGAYLKRYPIKNTIRYKEYNNQTRRLIFLGMFFFLGFINFGLFQTYKVIMSTTSDLDNYFQVLANGILFFNNPVVIIESVYFFVFFETFDFKNKLITKLSATVLGTYMLISNSFINGVIYKLFNLDQTNITDFNYLGYIFLITLLIFIICTLIEYIRIKLFNKLYSLNFSQKLKDKFNKWFNNLNFI